MKEKGIPLKLYEIPANKYFEIADDIETVIVNNDKKNVRFLIINGGEGRPEKLLPEAFEVPLPRMSTKLLEDENKRKQADAKIQAYLNEEEKMRECAVLSIVR